MSEYNPNIVALCKAIVATANRDYIKCIRHGDTAQYNRVELERFYHGPLFAAMSGDHITPDEYMAQIRNGANVRLNKSYHRKRKRKEAPVCLA